MYLGMTYDEFWHGDPFLPIAYRKMHVMKQDEKNQELWLQGYYNCIAVSTALQNGFREKGHKAIEYPKELVRIRPLTEAEKEQEKREAIDSLVRTLNRSKTVYDNKVKESDNGK